MQRTSLALACIAASTAARAAAQCDSQELDPPPLAAGDLFGTAVSVWGDTAAIGAPAAGTGSVHVYRRDATGTWQLEAELRAGGGAVGNGFGRSVAVAEDVIAVGAPLEDSIAFDAGTAYVFERAGGAWLEAGKLFGADTAIQDGFGGSIAVRGDTLVVGARGDDIGGDDVGSAYVFRRHGGAWIQQAKLTAGDGLPGDLFGSSVAIDGSRALVGAPGDDGAAPVQGSAYVFEGSAAAWVQAAKLVSSDASSYDQLGFDVALEGTTAVVSSPFAGVGTSTAGAAYVFRSDGAGPWAEIARLSPVPALPDSGFGFSVDIRAGVVVAVRMVSAAAGSGSVHRYVEQGGAWSESHAIPVPEMNPSDFLFGLGAGVGAHAQGLVVGAPGDGTLGDDAGAAYAFEFAPSGVLTGCPKKLAVSAGGTQRLVLDAGPAHGSALYLLLGSTSGTAPGLALGALVLPLNPDAYFAFTLANPNHPPLAASLGFLDPSGRAEATFVLPAAADAALAGIAAHHAAVVLSPSAFGAVDLATNAAELFLVP